VHARIRLPVGHDDEVLRAVGFDCGQELTSLSDGFGPS
jgi:hypothetical protein